MPERDLGWKPLNQLQQMKYPEYSGMSYEQASREAERLVQDGWYRNFDRLSALHHAMEIMANAYRPWPGPSVANGALMPDKEIV